MTGETRVYTFSKPEGTKTRRVVEAGMYEPISLRVDGEVSPALIHAALDAFLQYFRRGR